MLLADTDYFLSVRPAYPWSEYPAGLPALAAVAVLLVAVTLWTYLGHAHATRRRVLAITAVRLLALAVALVTAVRPSVGIQEQPKVPSYLLLGIDLSETMTVRDEFNNQSRIDAVRRVLERCEPVLEELRNEQNLSVVVYAFGDPAFSEPAGQFDPAAPADRKKSDYGTYLAKTLERWVGERFVRGHLVVGDGQDNGTTFAAAAEAGRWRGVAPVHTFGVGTETARSDARDVAVVAVSADPSPVPVKNDLAVKAVVNAYGYPSGTKVKFRLLFDTGDGYKPVAAEVGTFGKEKGNEVLFPVKAPDKPGEVKVKVEIAPEDVPAGDMAAANNSLETYLTVTKEGVRILYVDRTRVESAFVRRALAADKRMDLLEAPRQTDDPASPAERATYDFGSRAYDVLVLGNVSARQLRAIDPRLPETIRDQVRRKGMGLLLLGGDAAFTGGAEVPFGGGWKGTPLEEILPVDLDRSPTVRNSRIFREAPTAGIQAVPTAFGLDFLLRVAPTPEQSRELWDRLNGALQPPFRLTGLSRIGVPKPTARVYAVAADERQLVPAGRSADQYPQAAPLLVGHQIGDGNGRVLVFAGQDTYLWRGFGLRTPTKDGLTIHSQFWRRLVLWLAHQEEDEGAAYARPEFRRLPAGGKQSIKLGLRQPGGADAIDPTFTVKVVGPGQTAETAAPRPITPDPAGGARVAFDPPLPGEYTVLLTATGKAADGKEVKGEATARFIAYPEASDEMLKTAADPGTLRQIAAAGGGRFHRLEDLPAFLQELTGQPLDTVKPKPRFMPDWRRTHSGGFLPGWVAVFAALLAAEWGLRRLWGMV